MSEDLDFGEAIQRVLLSMMISDPQVFVRSQSIIDPAYFEDKLRPAIRYIKEFSDQYKTLPLPVQIAASTGINLDIIEETAQFEEWYLDTIEKFCRHRALENVILDGPDLLAKGQAGDLERRIKDAMTISLMSDLGTSYFDDPTARLNRLRDKSNFVSTGWKVLDQKLYGGFTRGSLNIFAGGSGSGKSLFLQNLALNWVFEGMNVIYFSLELSEDLVNMRIDSMVTNYATKDILRNIDNVAMKIALIQKKVKVGDLRVKKLPEAGTTANTLRAYMKEYQIKTGRKPDAICVDYLDLMYPNNAKIDVSSMFTKDKYVSEELRAIAGEWDIPVVSASQLNRQSVEAQEFDHSHIAGGISKINTADNVFGIFTSTSMKEAGRYQIQFLKTRSSNAVGSKCELKYNPDSLRIMDPDEDDDEESMRSTDTDAMRAQLNASATATMANTHTPAAAPATSSPIKSDVGSLLDRIHNRKL